MRLVLLGSRDTTIGKTNKWNMVLYIYLYLYNEIRVMEWRDESDGMEDEGRMVKN